VAAHRTDISFARCSGNLRLHAQIQGPEHAPLTVLCLHGLTRNLADFGSLAALLSARYRVLSADQRGRGKSQRDPHTAQPARLRGIVLNDIGPQVPVAGLQRLRSSLKGSTPVTTWSEASLQARRVNEIAFPDYGDAAWDAFVRRIYVEDPSGCPVPAVDPAILAGLNATDPSAVAPNLWSQWQHLKSIPILAIRGALSDILSAEILASMHSGMTSRNGT
jgi:pimeloyl-ACP methyl ester carboxylesterase